MRSPVPLTPNYYVSGQIEVGDLRWIADQGIRSILNVRHDGEDLVQLASGDLQAAAHRHGLEYRHLPVRSKVSEYDIQAFEAALGELQGPVLAFCRTGTRAAKLWVLAEARRLRLTRVLKAYYGEGYDLGAIRPRLDTISATGAMR